MISKDLSHTTDSVYETKIQLMSLHEQVFKLSNQLNEHIKNQNLKFEKFVQTIHRLDQSQNLLALESGEKMSLLSGKISERKAIDFKIQEIIDRHNALIKAYESRLSYLQKVLNTKEAQLETATSTLNEVRMEMAKLKR
jgi:hypothetical protein